MKLNHDCMRDCLLYLESIKNVQVNTDYDEMSISMDPIFIDQMFDDLKNWANQDIFYAVFNLQQGEYISTSMSCADDSFDNICVNYITLRGHEFLDTIRDEKRWHGIKKALNAVHDYSLSAINAIAEGMTAGAVSAYLSQ